jgi:bifunctional non-homologous end joining protein LigD
MFAQSAGAPFSRDGWLFEPKHDGVRVLVSREPGTAVRLQSRTGRDTTASFPEIAAAAAALDCDEFVLDGEIIAPDARGVGSFERLQKRLAPPDPVAVARLAGEIPVALECFDLLALAGYDLRGLPLSRRKELLRLLVPIRGVVRFCAHVERDGEALFAAAGTLGLEGIMAKRATAPYRSGDRSHDWLKIKAVRTADVAIVGFVRGKGARARLGSLMMAWWRDGALTYAGNVGSGLDDALMAELLPQLEAGRRRVPACRGSVPGPPARNVFVEPALVAEVRYGEITSKGMLRHPVFLRLRPDKATDACEAPPFGTAVAAPQRPAAAVRLTNLSKVFWREDRFTKGDLIAYYRDIWPLLAPYLRDRPLVLTRYPDGIDGRSFFQQAAPNAMPQWVHTVAVRGKRYIACDDLDTLLYVVNSGCIPLHLWSARAASIDHPDWAILDLDPKDAPFRHVVHVARRLHRILDEIHVPHFAKTSGQDGLHVLIPLGGTLTHAEARLLAELIARVVVAEEPQVATVARPLRARRGRVYVDFLQNGFGKTIVAPFSVRPRRGAPISAPLRWRQVRDGLDPSHFTMRTAAGLFSKQGDPMRPLLDTRSDVVAAVAALAARAAHAQE